MRSRKANEKYFKEERKKKYEQLKLYDEQDKQLINEMIRDYKIFHAISTVAVIWFIVIVGLIVYSII
jgi:uncharacterized protein YqhQ